MFVDKTLTCRECNEEFTFTVGEQEFFRSKGLINEPARCPACRVARRRAQQSGMERPMYDIVCDSCGADAKVPFEPRGDRPVYCSDCFLKTKATG